MLDWLTILLQERDQLLAQSEEATRMRLKQQEVAKKQQQLDLLLNHNKQRLANVLGVAAAGRCTDSPLACPLWQQ